MSNQCSDLCNYRSFSFCTPFRTPLKPYTTPLRPFFLFQHNLILLGRRSKRRSSTVPLTLAVHSSSDIVLIATTEHRDGSLVFQFGDASEVVGNDDVVEEIESQTAQESNVVKLDGEQDTQVTIKTGDRGDDSVKGILIEVADGTRNVYVDSDIAEGEIKAVRDLSDRLTDISEKEVRLFQSDAEMNDSIKVVESTFTEAKFSVQFDEEESSDPTICCSDDKTVDPSVSFESTQVSQLEVMDDLDMLETEDTGKGDTEYVSFEIESTKVLKIEVMDDLDKEETEDARESDTEDIVSSAFPASMQISDIKLADAVNEDLEEELKNMIIDEGTLIDELQPSNPLDVQLMDAVNEDVEEECKDMNANGATIIDEMPSSDQLVVEPTLDEVSQVQSVHMKDQTREDELQQVSTKISEENTVTYGMLRIVEEELIQPQSTPPELKPTIHVLNTDLQDTMSQNLDNGILQVYNQIKDLPVSVKLETIQVSDNEVMNVAQSYTKDESCMVESKDTSECDTKDLVPPATMHVSGVDMDKSLQDMNASETTFIDEMPTSDPLGAEPTLEVSTTKGMVVDIDERLQDMNISEGTFINEIPAFDPLGAEPSLEVSSTEGMDVKDLTVEDELQLVSNDKMDENEIADVMPAEPILEEVRNPHFTHVKHEDTISDIKIQDATGQNLDDEILQVINEDAGGSFVEDVQQSSHQLESQPFQDDGVKHNMLKQCASKLQDMNIRKGLFIDDMPTYDPLEAEPTLEVSSSEGMDGKDLAVEDELQLMSSEDMDENEITDVLPVEPILEEEVSWDHLTTVELKASMQVSDIKVQDTTGQILDNEILQVINEDAGDSYIVDVPQSPHQLESHPVQEEGVKHDMLEQCAESDAVESSILLKQGAHDPLLEAERTEGVVGSSDLAEASEVTKLLLAAEAEVEREEIYRADDFLLTGAALLEHPFKALAGGDDAYFVAGCNWLGVADGVSQWSFEGTGQGVYAQELMRTCENIVSDTSTVPMTNPVELLCRSVKETNMSGSSNVLIAHFNGQALHVANIGDTGFLIIRHGAIYKKSTALLHEFHFALQVEDSDDPLQLVEEYLIELEVGDVVVSATDGLLDNLYEREITMIVSKSLQAGMKPQEIAHILAARAQEVGKSAFVRSPFSDAAQAAGYTGYAGGKADNVVVIVSLVEKRSNLLPV